MMHRLLVGGLCALAFQALAQGTPTKPVPAVRPAFDAANADLPAPAPMHGAAQPGQPDRANAPAGTGAAPPGATQTAARDADHRANAASDVFGAQLFSGAFSNGTHAPFNPDYVVSIGDRLRLRMWGGFDFDAVLTVDAQGNIFLPHAGPMQVAGIANGRVQAAVTSALRRVFTPHVAVYVGLESAKPVRVFVAGFVRHPGMYDGTSNDSVLHYLDSAGGIDPERGSFLDVQIKRGHAVRAHLNLYDFLLRGELPAAQLGDGDVIFIGPRQGTARVSGLAGNAKRFEFAGAASTLPALAAAARPAPDVTHVRITRNTGTLSEVEYVALADSGGVIVRDGDQVAYTADKRPGTITVRVEGEHDGQQEYVLPYGSRVGALLARIQTSERAARDDIQLYRASVKQRQKELLQAQLRNLEAAVLTARSGTEEEARLRREEAAMVLQWVERARHIEPLGQVVLGRDDVRGNLLLENGDVLRIPVKDGLVLVGGEVLFPNAVAAAPSLSVGDYIAQAGGFTQHANSSRIVIAHQDGTFADGRRDRTVVAGDQVLVLPKVDFKTRQFAKDVFQILFQIAVSAKVALGL
ncbi:polysaccharide biosynthesis/export family protein [Robbsia sp. Bb-Pol-6]|uniref:Polysaccharide biosynthesis/export family protein n=1 Tax=Robbsia betulipollinis TaxID=2981849 RepID=A0ABT3ZKT1_9BURK|nr:polysaccharide biosynthesis/export family protein [Robbsia betulipollinis]MCY0386880.1 polysaccharide biosynthesis/export family protein [Robbsia betulipollinis]